ncbi:hypothetical protein G7Y89_g6864 [Cudoniella acicularis]|uniref:Copper transport protein n=1 Tax=Cudoniella acicularis TaxID=354080 RepID=A0A8H4RN35_9HELO|nr:hypothetical protein G7Y89_g6864 [Cudoniella acicularis]
MDMGSMTMATSTTTGMAGMASTTASAAAASSTSMSSMDMEAASCKISMLWNWYTIDACFLSSTWQITSKGMFAGSCIGVILLVMSLEFLRRSAKEYDRYILRQYQRAQTISSAPLIQPNKTSSIASDPPDPSLNGNRGIAAPFRPNIFQQAIRATFHMVQFGVAYIIMLLAMYYNGYIIISIIIGAWLGAFAFTWETTNTSPQESHKEEATLCCG